MCWVYSQSRLLTTHHTVLKNCGAPKRLLSSRHAVRIAYGDLLYYLAMQFTGLVANILVHSFYNCLLHPVVHENSISGNRTSRYKNVVPGHHRCSVTLKIFVSAVLFSLRLLDIRDAVRNYLATC